MKIIKLGSKSNIKGKAGTLNKLYNEFNIARGFIIPNEEFINFLKYNNISIKSKNIKQKIMQGTIPWEKALIKYFKKNNYNKAIVRSSAYIEDNNDYSFAGQFSSFTNTDINTLILNIKKCWISKFSDNVNTYIKEKNIKNNYAFDILIQEMIISDLSGVAFSINPTNGQKEIIVNITNLECEKLVSGKVIPKTYHIKDEVSDEKLLIIKNNLLKLKDLFKKEIEIEFCFKNNIFYLFQVRPITKIYFSLKDYINNEFWCSFKNNNWTTFNRTLWILGATKYKHKKIDNDITEDITIYYPYNQKQIRGFNGNQVPLNKKTLDNHLPEDINTYILEYNEISKKIKHLSNNIKDNINHNDFSSFNKNLKLIIKNNAILNSYEYLIGSLGQALYKTLDSPTIKNIEMWRNSENNSYFPIYDTIFNYVKDYFNLEIEASKLKMYIHVKELLNLCDKKINKEVLIKRINNREKKGFIILNLHNKKYNNKIITNSMVVNGVKNRFYNLLNNTNPKKPSNIITGTSTFKNGKIIKGKCVVIKNNEDISKFNINNKMLVCEVTSAQDIKYLKNVKALIVESGGVLCHSAIFSREFNIPCLMGCQRATNILKTGDIVSFDVDNEIVKKIENKKSK